jgi:hypothetical protein
MDIELVNKLDSIRDNLGHALVLIHPDNSAEWEIFEKVTQAHKILRSIDLSEIAQAKLI